jgi:hypothetical protein
MSLLGRSWRRTTADRRHRRMTLDGRVRVAMNDCFADAQPPSGRSGHRAALEKLDLPVWVGSRLTLTRSDHQKAAGRIGWQYSGRSGKPGFGHRLTLACGSRVPASDWVLPVKSRGRMSADAQTCRSGLTGSTGRFARKLTFIPSFVDEPRVPHEAGVQRRLPHSANRRRRPILVHSPARGPQPCQSRGRWP